MGHERFRDWFSRVDELTAAQRKEVTAVLSDPPEGAASLAAIELGVDDERRCVVGQGARSSPLPVQGVREDLRCAHGHGVVGSAPQGALAVLWRLAWRRQTIKECVERCGIAPSTAHRWRHRFLAEVRQAPDRLAGIVEADETFVLESRKGSGSWTASRVGAAAKPRSAASCVLILAYLTEVLATLDGESGDT
ncbi:MAG: hypothetical protein OXC28_09455 [Defluviicoccus sp.]|nr:hypothetical protein [Defluviicoccus sp.]